MDETETFSIYLQLAQGQKADLETVARASLALTAALKEVAFFLDPNLDLRIELASGTELSLTLNSILKSVKAKAGDRKLLLGLAAGAVGFILGEIAHDVYEGSPLHILIQGHPDGQISDADLKRIVEEVAKAAKSDPARSHVQDFYRELDRDPSISGVGAMLSPNTRPTVIVPRAQFRARSGVEEVIETTSQEREKTTIETLILVSPVLLQGDRKWRFKSGTGEFGATVDDDVFLTEVLSGRRVIPMISGLLVEVELKTVEEKTPEGLWKPIDRRVVRVIDIRSPPSQNSMDFSATRSDKGDGNNGK